MICVDANLLLYAYDQSSPVHQPASRWLANAFSGSEPIGLTWPTLLAFLRIATSAKIFRDPLSIDEAVAIVDDWLDHPLVHVLEAGEGHWNQLRSLLLETGSNGKLVMDAHLAALSLEHGTTLITRDRDFALFPGLRVVNPLF